ncbi:MAG: nitrite reductase/ring-hydroxylating ferredoxin subunit [Saprospiraceae bacterium]|jgi:nitrite reductase/ring-hydroxylating ferredoxin subunit
MNTKIVTIVLIGAITCFSCSKTNSFIPNVPVQLVLNTLDPQYQNLNGIGGWSYVDGGSRGIIVFRSDFNEFKAYDRHCSFEPENSCGKVSVSDNNLFAEDSCCSSQFQLIDGLPVNGPATIGLQQYNTSFDGNIIQVWN